MRGYFDVGLFDIDTYDEGINVPRTGTDLKAEMKRVVDELDALAADPSMSPAFLVEAIRSVQADAALSIAIVEPDITGGNWPLREGRPMASDVADSAHALAREVQYVIDHGVPNPWLDVKRHIHPAWFSFYDDEHTD